MLKLSVSVRSTLHHNFTTVSFQFTVEKDPGTSLNGIKSTQIIRLIRTNQNRAQTMFQALQNLLEVTVNNNATRRSKNTTYLDAKALVFLALLKIWIEV